MNATMNPMTLELVVPERVLRTFVVEFSYVWQGCTVSGQRPERAVDLRQARGLTREWIWLRLGLGSRARDVAACAVLRAREV